MKTLTIKQDIIGSLDSDTSKLEFVNSVIALLSDTKQALSSKIGEVLTQGLNSDIPEPMEEAPDFDSSNMCAQEVKRYSFVRAGYVPAGRNGLDCPYSGYEYEQLSTLAEGKFEMLWHSAVLKIKQSKGKPGYVKFLKYLCSIYSWFYFKDF